MPKHDFDTDANDAVEALDAKTIKELRIALKKAPGVGQVNVDELSDAEVIDAADEAGIIDLDELRDKYEERNPEVHREGDERPQGLDTPTSEEISPKDLLLDEVQHNVARGYGVELEGTDLATKAAQFRAEQYAEQRDLAEELVDHRQDVDDASRLTDAELRDLTEEEAQKTLLGEEGNPNDLDTVVEHMRASRIGRLTTDHGYAREDLDDLTLDQLVGLEAQQGTGGETTGSADAAVRDVAGRVVESVTDGPGIDDSVTDDVSADAGGGDTGPAAGATPDESNAPSGSGESVPIVYTQQETMSEGDAGNFHRSADGRWFDGQGNEVTSPEDLEELEGGYESFAAMPGFVPTGNVESITPTGTSHEDAVSAQSDDSGSQSDDTTTDSDSDSEDGSGDDDDDDDSDDGDGDGDGDGDDTEDAEAVDGEDEEGETSESEGGNTEEGTPNPLGDDLIDPEDQARFDDTVFGDEQRQDQVDAIDDRSGRAGGPDDDPSDLDTEAFLDTKAGAEAAETLADGVEHHQDGGDTDPADFDAVESNGEVVEIKVSGGGLTDPVDDVPTAAPTFGDGERGNPIADAPPIATGPERFGTDETESNVFDHVEAEAAAADPFEGLDTEARIDFEEIDVVTEVELDDVDLVAD